MFLATLKPTVTAGSATAATLRNSDSPLFQCPLARSHRPPASFPALSSGRATAIPALSINAPVVSSASSATSTVLSWSWAIDLPPTGPPGRPASLPASLPARRRRRKFVQTLQGGSLRFWCAIEFPLPALPLVGPGTDGATLRHLRRRGRDRALRRLPLQLLRPVLDGLARGRASARPCPGSDFRRLAVMPGGTARERKWRRFCRAGGRRRRNGQAAGARRGRRNGRRRAQEAAQSLSAPAREEQMQGVRGGEHLPAPAAEEPMQGVRGGGHLPAPAREEQMQGVRGSEHLPPPASKEFMQGVRGGEHLPPPAAKERMQGVRGGGHLPPPARKEHMQGLCWGGQAICA